MNALYLKEENRLLDAESMAELTRQIVARCRPAKIYLFGSHAKGLVRPSSDIDLCLVVQTDDARKLNQDLQLNLDVDASLDFVIYTPAAWDKHVGDPGSFAYQIQSKGVLLYGGQ